MLRLQVVMLVGDVLSMLGSKDMHPPEILKLKRGRLVTSKILATARILPSLVELYLFWGEAWGRSSPSPPTGGNPDELLDV